MSEGSVATEGEANQGLMLQISDEPFLKENKHITRAHKIAYSPDGSKYFVKTSLYLVAPPDELPEWLNINEQKEVAEQNFEREEFAWRLANYLGVPMAETHTITIDGLPWVAAKFIEGAEDKAFGGNIKTGSEKIKTELGKVAAFKFIAGLGGDNGQYLEAPDDQVYVMDAQVPYDSGNYTETTEEELLGLVLKGDIEPFGNVTNIVLAQLNAIGSGWVDDVLDKASSLDEDTLLELSAGLNSTNSETRLNGARRIIDRAKSAKKILHFLAENKDLTIKAINPYFAGENRRLTTDSDQTTAKAELAKRSKNQSQNI